MQIVLERALSLTGSPLISLVVLSVAVTLGALPFYHFAESWQDEERKIQKKLRPKIDEFKSVFKGAALNSYIRTLYRQNNYHPMLAIRSSLGLLIQIPFFFAAYHLLSNYSPFNGVETVLFNDLGKPDAMVTIAGFSVNILPLLMTAVNICSILIYGKKTSLKENLQLYGIALLFLIVLYNSPSALLFYWTFNNLFALVKNLIYLLIYKDGAITKREKGVSKTTQKIEKLFNFIPDSTKETGKMFKLSLAGFLLLSFISAPLAVLSSGSSSDFEESVFYFLNYLFFFSLAIFLAGLLLFYVSNSKVKTVLAFTALFALLFGLANTFVFAGNYGDMSHFVFNEDLEIDTLEVTLNLLTGAVLLAVTSLFFKKRTRAVRQVLPVILISLIFFSANEAFAYNKKRAKTHSNALEENHYLFSKTEKNVVILMLDRFIGGYIPEIIELMPNLKTDFDGFVYYKNSLSQASFTIGGVPPILGGWEYSVHNANNFRTDVPLLKKLDESSRVLPYNFDKAGYGVKIFRTDYINWFDTDTNWVDESNKEYIGNTLFIKPDYPKYREMWLKKHEKEGGSDDALRKKLLAFGLFRASPLFAREFIYDEGEWHIEQEEVQPDYEKPDEQKFVIANQKSKHRRDTTLKYYAELDFLPELSRVVEGDKGQFTFISNNLTHEPHSINSDFKYEITGKVAYPRTMFVKFNRSLTSLRHLYTDAAALRLVNNWLSWMKENGVYDNTRIVIVSDHGRDVFNPFFKQQRIPKTRKKAHPAYYNNLFLVKDFNSRGTLVTETESFMTSADVPAIAVKDLIADPINPYSDEKIEIPENKFPFYIYDIQWRVEKQDKFKYRYHEKYVIDKFEDIDSPSKWRRLYD
ncbi:MAG: YidC/Oxa1 family membrane protein insertase [bacterium]